MRTFRIIIMTVVAAMAAALFSACSADEPEMTPEKINEEKNDEAKSSEENTPLPSPEFTFSSFAELIATPSDVALSPSEIKSYLKDDLTNGGWEEFDYTQYIGYSVPAPRIIVVSNGKVYTEITLWSSANGPTYFSTALGLLMKVGAVERGSVIISRDFDIEANIIKDCGISLSVADIKDDKMRLSAITTYDGGRTHNGGQEMYVVTYTMNKCKDNSYRFESVEDAYRWVIDEFRARFGEEVNRNYYTDGKIEYDQPMFNVAMVEYELMLYLSGNLRMAL